jgi:hypothetical protein
VNPDSWPPTAGSQYDGRTGATAARVLVAAALLALLATMATRVVVRAQPPQPLQPPAAAEATEHLYICPMDPEVSLPAQGTCWKCGMALVMGDPLDAGEYLVDLDTAPKALRAGEPATLTITVRHPVTLDAIADFGVLQDHPLHLFVVSQDLQYFEHLHPAARDDGTFSVPLTLPRPGYYKVFSDFLPIGGAPQMVSRQLVTAGFTGDLSTSAARLTADTSLKRTAGGLAFTLTPPTDGLVAGREEKLSYEIADAKTGAPVRDLEAWDAGFGYTWLLSEDTLHPIHAHALEPLSAGESRDVKGGPELSFRGLLPRPGKYRVWTEVRRGGAPATVAFTIDVASPTTLRSPDGNGGR